MPNFSSLGYTLFFTLSHAHVAKKHADVGKETRRCYKGTLRCYKEKNSTKLCF